MFCGFAIRSRESVMYYGLGDCKSPGLIGRTFFYDGLQIRRDAWRGMGRLAGYGTPGGGWDAWRCVWDGWRGGFQGTKKSWNLRR